MDNNIEDHVLRKFRRYNSNCYIWALVLTCFRLTKGRATHFRPETIVASFLHLMVLLSKVLLNHSWKQSSSNLWCFVNIFVIFSLVDSCDIRHMCSLSPWKINKLLKSCPPLRIWNADRLLKWFLIDFPKEEIIQFVCTYIL